MRTLERDISGAQEFNPIVGHNVPITVNMADEYEETILHMVNADPNREPTLTLFGDPSFYFQSSCDTGASTQPGCPLQGNGFAWNHGDIQPEIATTWQGWVGPGIKNLGETSSVWTDHTDARPTMMTVLGLHDDYSWDGAAIAQIIGSTHSGWDWWSHGESALPWSIRVDERDYEDLAAAYKQLDAPFGEFGLGTLDADTTALASGSSSDDTAYTGHDLAAPGVREPAHRARIADPAGDRGGRDRPGSGVELGCRLPDRTGRPPDRRRKVPGRGVDPAALHRLRLEAFAAAPRRPPNRAGEGQHSPSTPVLLLPFLRRCMNDDDPSRSSSSQTKGCPARTELCPSRAAGGVARSRAWQVPAHR